MAIILELLFGVKRLLPVALLNAKLNEATTELYARAFSDAESHELIVSFHRLQALEDVNVTYDDQQRINKFARKTSRLTELKNEIESKKVSEEHVRVMFPSRDPNY